MSKFRIYNDKLAPLLWDEYQHLNPRVRVNLLRMAYDFYEKTEFKAPIVDIFLMGSSANYNWTPDSDVDVHVIIDYNRLQMPPETAEKAIKVAGSQWNTEHQVWAKGHKVEMNLQNVNEVKPHVTGIYSLVRDEWVRKPSKQIVSIDKSTIQAKFSGMSKYINSVIKSGDRESMKQAKKYIDAFRQYGLDHSGEMSVENIVFKILRSKGLIKKLKDSITMVYDKEMTVSENGAVPEKFDYIGTVMDDQIRAERIRLGKSKFHMHSDHPGLILGIHYNGWRYDGVRNTVGWNIGPTPEQRHMVDGFLKSRGINASHKNLYEHTRNIRRKITESKESLIQKQLPHLNNDNLFVVIQRDDEYSNENYVQVDAASGGQNHFSSNPEMLNTMGYPMPTSRELLRLPKGRYKLADAIAALKKITEVSQKDITSRHPTLGQLSYDKNFQIRLDKLTLANLKALREKAHRSFNYCARRSDQAGMENADSEFSKFDMEIKKRLNSINTPFVEGYGMGDPSKDPKAVGRWTVKYDSSSKILKEGILLESMYVYVKGVDVDDKLNTLDGLCNYLLRVVLNPILTNGPEDQLNYFRKNGSYYNTIVPDGDYWMGQEQGHGTINLYISGLMSETLKIILKGIVEKCKALGIEVGTISPPEQSKSLNSQVIRIPVIKNNVVPSDSPPELNLSNRNAYHIFKQVLQFDPDDESGSGFYFKTQDLIDSIKSISGDRGWIKQHAIPTKTISPKPPEDGDDWKDDQESEEPSDNPHDAIANSIGKGLGATVHSMGIDDDRIKDVLAQLLKIAKWAKEHGHSEMYVA